MSNLLTLFAEFKAKRKQRKKPIDPEKDQGTLKVTETGEEYSAAGTGTEIETEPAEERCEVDFWGDETSN